MATRIEVVQAATADVLAVREGKALVRLSYWEFPRTWLIRRELKFSPKKHRFVFTIKFRVLPELTERTIAVAEAFGIGVDYEQEFPIYSQFELKVGPRDVVYITGPSGSGKSVLLRALKRELGSLWPVADMAEVPIDRDKPIIDTIGRNVDEAIRLLSRAGLGEAFLWLRKYDELSDGQKYRYRLAKLLESQAQMWVADEFCSMLDRDTARIVAFNVQKLARKLGKGLLAATTHTDLFEDLGPSIHIIKGFGDEVEVRYYPNELVRECSLMREMEFGPLPTGRSAEARAIRREALKFVEKWHYRGRRPAFKYIFAAKRNDRLAGVVLISRPYIQCAGRKVVFKKGLPAYHMNKWAYCLPRVVVHPLYRGIGLGKRLVRETLNWLADKAAYVELVAVMARYNPFAERAGMVRVCEIQPSKKLLKAVELLEELGFDRRFLASERYTLQKLTAMSEAELNQVRSVFLRYKTPGIMKELFPNRAIVYPDEWAEGIARAGPRELARLIYTLANAVSPKVYLIWRSPLWPVGSCPLDELVRPEWRGKLFRSVRYREELEA